MIYHGPIRLKTDTCFYFFQLATVLIGVSDFKAPRPIAGGCGNDFSPGQLATWGGTITLSDCALYKRCGELFHLDTGNRKGDIYIYETELIEGGTKVWFDGVGTLIYTD